jgi:hypothetical protein
MESPLGCFVLHLTLIVVLTSQAGGFVNLKTKFSFDADFESDICLLNAINGTKMILKCTRIFVGAVIVGLCRICMAWPPGAPILDLNWPKPLYQIDTILAGTTVEVISDTTQICLNASLPVQWQEVFINSSLHLAYATPSGHSEPGRWRVQASFENITISKIRLASYLAYDNVVLMPADAAGDSRFTWCTNDDESNAWAFSTAFRQLIRFVDLDASVEYFEGLTTILRLRLIRYMSNEIQPCDEMHQVRDNLEEQNRPRQLFIVINC